MRSPRMYTIDSSLSASRVQTSLERSLQTTVANQPYVIYARTGEKDETYPKLGKERENLRPWNGCVCSCQ